MADSLQKVEGKKKGWAQPGIEPGTSRIQTNPKRESYY